MKFGTLALAQLAAMASGLFAGFSHLKLALFTDNTPINSGTDLSLLAEPGSSWYARKTATVGDPIETTDRGIEISVQSQQWTYSGTDSPETVYGWLLLDEGAGPGPVTYLAAGNFETPVTFTTGLDGVVAEPALVIPAVEQS